MIYLNGKSAIESHRELVLLFKSNLFTTEDSLLEKETSAVIELVNFENCDVVGMENGKVKINYQEICNYVYVSEAKAKEEEFYYSKITQNGLILDEIVMHLRKDINSRRCVYNFWEKKYFEDKNSGGACINYIYFRFKDKKLYMHSHMRANDLIDCYILDICFLYFVGKSVSERVGIPFGGLIHFVDSLQLYKKSLQIFDKLYEQ